jgi:hypothetical protein
MLLLTLVDATVILLLIQTQLIETFIMEAKNAMTGSLVHPCSNTTIQLMSVILTETQLTAEVITTTFS